MAPKRVMAWALVLALCACAVFVSTIVGGRSYIIASVFIVLCAMAPFFYEFEASAPNARELVLVATLCALAVVSRAAFAMLPNFKPVAGVCIIAGIALGSRGGFMVGALAMLVSNFMFGQGIWTPWQMLAFGICGLAGGLSVRAGFWPRHHIAQKRKLVLSVSGALLILLIVGPILDTCSLFFAISDITPQSAAAIYLAGVPFNAIHATATALTLFFASNPLLNGINKALEKYGLTESHS